MLFHRQVHNGDEMEKETHELGQECEDDLGDVTELRWKLFVSKVLIHWYFWLGSAIRIYDLYHTVFGKFIDATHF